MSSFLGLSDPPSPVCIGRFKKICYQGGWISSSCGEGKFESYQGIRYGVSPVGDLRFKAPRPFIPDEGTYNVSQISKVSCPQINLNWWEKSKYNGQEDCLMLNIYTPEKNSSNLDNLPVMVWIHGGGFNFGSNQFKNFNPEHLVDKGVIVVTINYRLGAFGFLSLGDESVPGNAGLKDQILALSWIQEHIESFGGDQKAVTIFGGSAGSYSISALLISPLSKGLFHRVISQSGTMLATSWKTLLPDEALNISSSFTQILGCQSNNLTCLQEQSIDAILFTLETLDFRKYVSIFLLICIRK